MAIVYPLTPPAELTFKSLDFMPQTIVGMTKSLYTGQAQTFVWPGQWWSGVGVIPPLKNFTGAAAADNVVAFLLALNGVQGTFLLGDPSRPTTRGAAVGAWTVGPGNVADSTTLITNAGAGGFVKGDWLQISTYLHKVIQVNSATSYEVWPRLRIAYVNGTAITYNNPKGLFRLSDNQSMRFSINDIKMYGVTINFEESL